MRSRRPLLASCAVLLLASCGGGRDFDEAEPEALAAAPVSVTDEDRLPALLEDAGLVTFRTALAQAYLVDSLESQGPFTVFAPTDGAFEAMKGTTPQQLLRPTNREALRTLVAYHVVPGALPTEAIPDAGAVQTYGGQRLILQRRGADLFVLGGQGTSARVVHTDIEASNGVVHLLDAVLLPPPEGDSLVVPAAPDSLAPSARAPRCSGRAPSRWGRARYSRSARCRGSA